MIFTAGRRIKMNDAQYIWKILPDISRTFAFTIPKLPKEVALDLAIAYAVCRIIDTIEDSNLSSEKKKSLMGLMIKVLTEPRPKIAEFCDAMNLLSEDKEYLELVEKTGKVIGALRSRPSKVQEIIVKNAVVMAKGFVEDGVQNIKTFSQQNKYCFYAAGIVGHTINELFGHYGYLSQKEVEELMPLAEDNGLALQKVNIMKDILDDVKDGRHYWPAELLAKYGLTYKTLGSKEHMEESMKVLGELHEDVKPYFARSLNYIHRLPDKPAGLRIFCANNVLMAIATARTITDSKLFTNERVKITREEVYAIDREVTRCVENGEPLDMLAIGLEKNALR